MDFDHVKRWSEGAEFSPRPFYAPPTALEMANAFQKIYYRWQALASAPGEETIGDHIPIYAGALQTPELEQCPIYHYDELQPMRRMHRSYADESPCYVSMLDLLMLEMIGKPEDDSLTLAPYWITARRLVQRWKALSLKDLEERTVSAYSGLSCYTVDNWKGFHKWEGARGSVHLERFLFDLQDVQRYESEDREVFPKWWNHPLDRIGCQDFVRWWLTMDPNVPKREILRRLRSEEIGYGKGHPDRRIWNEWLRKPGIVEKGQAGRPKGSTKSKQSRKTVR